MEQKSVERWGRPVNTYHVMWRKWKKADIGGVVPNYKLVPNKPESEFLTSQVEYYQSCGCLGPSLAVKHPMKMSSMLFECKPLSPCVHCSSTWCYSCDKRSQAFPVFPKNARTIIAWLASSSRQRQVALATSLLIKEKGSLWKTEVNQSNL